MKGNCKKKTQKTKGEKKKPYEKPTLIKYKQFKEVFAITSPT